MKKFKRYLAIILALVGSIFTIFLFVTGIINIINACDPFTLKLLVIGILKVFFCEIPASIGIILAKILI